MTVFDHDAADKARAENPSLTIFDTGQMLEPGLVIEDYLDTYGPMQANRTRKTGLVEFTNDESRPVLSVIAHPSVTDDDTTLVRIETPGGGRFKIALNDHEIWVGDTDADPAPVSSPPEEKTLVSGSGDFRYRMIASTPEQDAALAKHHVTLAECTQVKPFAALRAVTVEDARVIVETFEPDGRHTWREAYVPEEDWGDPAEVSDPTNEESEPTDG